MIDESEKMIKDTRKRMGTAAADLRNLVVRRESFGIPLYLGAPY